MDCIFCKIANGEIPSEFVYEDDQVVVINDLNPQAPVHMLVLPKKHIACLSESSDEDQALLGHMLRVAAKAAELRGIAAPGFRLVINNGKDGAQSVMHLHMHVLGGKQMAESMA